MLSELYIDNFIIIKKNHIFLEEGFNVITGETGSGKSIILEAINLLLGKRANKESIGKFKDRTLIEGVFVLDRASIKLFEEKGISFDDDKLIISRNIGKTSSSIRINGRLANLNILKELSPHLIDIYKQGDSNIYMNRSNYIKLIDSYKNDQETKDLLKSLSDLVGLRNEKIKKIENLDLTEEEITRERDLLNYQIAEIEDIDIFNLDEESLDAEYKRLSNISSLRDAYYKLMDLIESDDYNTPSISYMLSDAISSIDDFISIDKKTSDLYDRLVALSDEINQIYSDVDYYIDVLSGDPEKLEELELINKKLFSIKRKYGNSIEDIKTYYQSMKERLDELEQVEDLRSNIIDVISAYDEKIEQVSLKLHDIRINKAKSLEKSINKEILDLNIKNGKFKIVITKKDKVDKSGFDDVDFLIKTNKGEDLTSLDKTASGGEISRIMLAFKQVFSNYDNIDTMIFDEIDTGISGRTAQIVGEKILDISKDRQILAISHLPQIASLANNHILISKEDIDDSTISTSKTILGDDRTSEIARLIGGVDITETTKKSAREILEMAEDLRNE